MENGGIYTLKRPSCKRKIKWASRPGLVTATPFCEGAPLLPNLRGYFAEFLRGSCLAPLGILYLPTYVGFG
ncbi:hypothetical protein SETIT_2G147300v2 [Setaria italica]|uniref:Uncharacterized protein n=1 Tax=Setaria italica TaxID=4555 RepID=A0A368PYR4_SETIT|nr:hypothetical protein SETIT_2G147300v2 [Setaria italica]